MAGTSSDLDNWNTWEPGFEFFYMGGELDCSPYSDQPTFQNINGTWYYEKYNYEKTGEYIMDPYSALANIKAVTMTWNESKPIGTDINVYVSNDKEASWHLMPNSGDRVVFPSFTDLNREFTYKVEMTGDGFVTPWIDDLDFQVETYFPIEVEPPVIEGNPLDPDGKYFSGDVVEINAWDVIKDLDNERDGYTWAWDFGDNRTTGTNPNTDNTPWNATHRYNYPGIYTINLTVTDRDDFSDTAESEVVIHNRIPWVITHLENPTTGVRTQGDLSAKVNEQLTLDGMESIDPDGLILRAVWTIVNEDGEEKVRPGRKVLWTPREKGNYTVYMTCEDDFFNEQGINHSREYKVYVTEDFYWPTAIYYPGERRVQKDHIIDLDGSQSFIDPALTLDTLTWDLGDGREENDTQISYSYPESGEYSVNLTVTDSKGRSSSFISYKDAQKEDYTFQITPFPPFGDWIIKGHEVLEDMSETMNWRNDIIIENGGWLEMRNLSWLWDPLSHAVQLKLDVQDGGKLTLDNVIMTTNVMPVSTEGQGKEYHTFFQFVTAGDTTITGSDIQYLDAKKEMFINGISVMTNGALWVHDSRIINAEDTAISKGIIALTVNERPLEVSNSRLGLSARSITVRQSDGLLLENNEFYGNTMDHIYLESVGKNSSIMTNSLKNAESGGVTCNKYAGSLVGNTIEQCGLYGVTFEGSEATFTGNTIWGSGRNTSCLQVIGKATGTDNSYTYGQKGIWVFNSAEYDSFSEELFRNTDDFAIDTGGQARVWNKLDFKAKINGKPITQANITVYFRERVNTSLMTNNQGIAGPIWLISSRWTSEGQELYNYTVQLKHTGLEIRENKTIEMDEGDTTLEFIFGREQPPDPPEPAPIKRWFEDQKVWIYAILAVIWVVAIVLLFAYPGYYDDMEEDVQTYINGGLVLAGIGTLGLIMWLEGIGVWGWAVLAWAVVTVPLYAYPRYIDEIDMDYQEWVTRGILAGIFITGAVVGFIEGWTFIAWASIVVLVGYIAYLAGPTAYDYYLEAKE